VERFHEARAGLLSAFHELVELANACSIMGNDVLGRKLLALAYRIDEDSKTCQEVFNEQMDELLSATRQGTANMLSGVMAGIRIGQQDPAKP
jgi:hypothetical protein